MGMDPYVKDLVDLLAKIAGLITVGAAALGLWLRFRRWQDDRDKSLKEQEKARDLRSEELRWRKASLARDALGDFLEDPLAIHAMQMLDWADRKYTIKGETVRITRKDMLEALRTTNLNFSETESYIRDCFDNFFGHLQLIQHFLTVNLLMLEDVAYPAMYYATLLGHDKKQFERFLNAYEYTLAKEFLAHFEGWNRPSHQGG